MLSLDQAIVAEYVRRNIPADQIVSDPELSAAFTKSVNGQLGEGVRVDQAALGKRLLNLRRRGEDNGGLPRLRRGYNGRGPKPR